MRQCACGATLVELVVVLAIAGFVGVLVVRTEPLGGRLVLRTAAAGVVSELRTAQARSLAERNPDRAYGVEFAPGGDRYTLFTRTGRVRTTIRTHRLPGRVRVTYARFGGSNTGSVMFSGVSLFGAPSGGGTVTLASGRARLCIRLLPATGRVRVARADCP